MKIVIDLLIVMRLILEVWSCYSYSYDQITQEMIFIDVGVSFCSAC